MAGPAAEEDVSSNPYAEVDLPNARRFAAIGWVIAGLTAAAFLPFFPPTDRYEGAAGWLLLVAAAALLGAPSLIAMLREGGGAALLFTGFAGTALIGWVAFLAGAQSPYSHLLLFVVMATALAQPPPRLAAVLVVVACVAFAPVAYDPDDFQAGDAAMHVILWLGLSVFITGLIGKLREQRRELRRIGEEAEATARVDELTGLRNRRAFEEDLATEIERSRRGGHALSLAVVDLDDFKSINDVHGHLAGDTALQSVAGVLTREVRTIDGRYRWGGDEFAVLLPTADGVLAEGAMGRLKAAIETDCRRPDGRPLRMTYGVAELAPDMIGEELVDQADADLLERKPGERRARAG